MELITSGSRTPATYRHGRLITTVAALSASLVLLSACGGGGGDGGESQQLQQAQQSLNPDPVAGDTVPEAFTFAPVQDWPWGAVAESGEVTIRGINAATPIYVSGGSYSINGAAFTSAIGTISEGQRVRLRVQADIDPGATAEAMIDIGGVTATFTVKTTMAALAANKFVHSNAEFLSVIENLQKGDVVDIYHKSSPYPAVVIEAKGTADQPIILRGIANSNGIRPTIKGEVNPGNTTVMIHEDSRHLVIDNLQITNDTDRAVGSCLLNVGHEVTLRRTRVFNCGNHGILGADYAGSLTLDRVEVSGAGCTGNMGCDGTNEKHPVYVATHPIKFPGAALRIQNSYFHDNNAGETIKSRAQRAEIRYNWIESVKRQFRPLGMYGYDRNLNGEHEADVDNPIHHDIVGNVILVSSDPGYKPTSMARFGGDSADKSSHGRTRFVNNTVLLSTDFTGTWGKPVIQLHFGIEGFSAFNNIFAVAAGNGVEPPLTALVKEENVIQWAGGRRKLTLTHNRIPKGSGVYRLGDGAPVPQEGLIMADFGSWVHSDLPWNVLANMSNFNPRLPDDSPLRARGTTFTQAPLFPQIGALRLPLREATQKQDPGKVPVIGAPRSDLAAPSLGAMN